jgi:hypothetical protein
LKEARALDGVVTVEDEDGEEYPLGESLARAIFSEDSETCVRASALRT